MRACSITILCLFSVQLSTSQPLDFLRSDTGNNRRNLPRILVISLKGQFGKTLTTDVPVLEESIELHPSSALEFRLGISTYGRKRWQQLHHYPDFGFGFYQSRFLPRDNPLGQPRAVYFYYNQTFIRKGRFSLNYDFVNGMSFHFNEYDPVDNPRQVGIGSEYNGHVSLGLEGRVMLTESLVLGLGINHTHFSNGRIKTPQRGINQVAVNGSLNVRFIDPMQKKRTGYTGTGSPPSRITQQIPAFTPLWEFYLVANTAVAAPAEDYRERDILYSIFTGSVAAARHYSHKGKLAVGLDIFCDESMSEKYGVSVADLTLRNRFYFGLQAGHELMVNRFTLVTQLGISLDNREVNGNWYGRFGMRIDITRDIFIRYALKLPDNWESDFIEWGMGFSLIKRPDKR